MDSISALSVDIHSDARPAKGEDGWLPVADWVTDGTVEISDWMIDGRGGF